MSRRRFAAPEQVVAEMERVMRDLGYESATGNRNNRGTREARRIAKLALLYVTMTVPRARRAYGRRR